MKRVAIGISGGGSNMLALVKSMTGNHPARPVLVFSNEPEASGLQKARDLGIPVAAINHKTYKGDRHAFEADLNEKLEDARPDIICLAGFMRILTAQFINNWEGKLLNIHPSLLPAHKGLNTHARAVEAGDPFGGCTVHRVTAELDAGPILGQSQVAIDKDDTAKSLAAKVLRLEHELYPRILREVVSGEIH